MVMNKSLQVRCLAVAFPERQRLMSTAGRQHPEYERGTGRANVQELPVECAVPLGRYVSLPLSVWLLEWR